MNKQALETLVTDANLLYRELKEKGARLEELKDKIRKEAERVAQGSSEKVTFESPGGNAEVVFVSNKCVLKKGANPLGLKADLAETTWSHLFEEKVVLSSEFEDALKLLAAPERTKVKALVEWKPQEPRVALDK